MRVLSHGFVEASVLVVAAVAVTTRIPVPTTPQGQHHPAVSFVADFIATYMPGSRLLTIVGDAPWLGGLLQLMATNQSYPAVVQLTFSNISYTRETDLDGMEDMNYSGPAFFSSNRYFFGWMAAHVLVVLGRSNPYRFRTAIRLLSPRSQFHPVLAVYIMKQTSEGNQVSEVHLRRSMTTIFRSAGKIGRFETVILTPEGRDHLGLGGSVWGFQPYVHGCMNINPIRLDSWTSSTGFQSPGPLFRDSVRYTYNGCPIRTTFFSLPTVGSVQVKNGTLSMGGFTGHLLRVFGHFTNASFTLANVSGLAKFRGIAMPTQLGETVLGKAELTVGPITLLHARASVLEWSNAPSSECYVWVVPSALRNTEHDGMNNLVGVFKWRLWASLAGMVGVTAVAMVLASIGVGRGHGGWSLRLGPGSALLSVVSALLAQRCLFCLPDSLPGRCRILFGLWALMVLTISSSYQAKLLSNLPRMIHVVPLTLEELAASGLPVDVPSLIVHDFIDSSNKALQTLIDNSEHRKAASGAHMSIRLHGGHISLVEEQLAKWQGVFDPKESEAENVVLSRLPGCFATYPSNYFAVSRGSPLLRRLDTLWKWMWQAGILDRMMADGKSSQQGPRRNRKKPPGSLNLGNIYGAFEILGIMLLVACAVFLAELVLFNCVCVRLAVRACRRLCCTRRARQAATRSRR